VTNSMTTPGAIATNSRHSPESGTSQSSYETPPSRIRSSKEGHP
jgi:hypothetical protein